MGEVLENNDYQEAPDYRDESMSAVIRRVIRTEDLTNYWRRGDWPSERVGKSEDTEEDDHGVRHCIQFEELGKSVVEHLMIADYRRDRDLAKFITNLSFISAIPDAISYHDERQLMTHDKKGHAPMGALIYFLEATEYIEKLHSDSGRIKIMKVLETRAAKSVGELLKDEYKKHKLLEGCDEEFLKQIVNKIDNHEELTDEERKQFAYELTFTHAKGKRAMYAERHIETEEDIVLKDMANYYNRLNSYYAYMGNYFKTIEQIVISATMIMNHANPQRLAKEGTVQFTPYRALVQLRREWGVSDEDRSLRKVIQKFPEEYRERIQRIWSNGEQEELITNPFHQERLDYWTKAFTAVDVLLTLWGGGSVDSFDEAIYGGIVSGCRTLKTSSKMKDFTRPFFQWGEYDKNGQGSLLEEYEQRVARGNIPGGSIDDISRFLVEGELQSLVEDEDLNTFVGFLILARNRALRILTEAVLTGEMESIRGIYDSLLEHDSRVLMGKYKLDTKTFQKLDRWYLEEKRKVGETIGKKGQRMNAPKNAKFASVVFWAHQQKIQGLLDIQRERIIQRYGIDESTNISQYPLIKLIQQRPIMILAGVA